MFDYILLADITNDTDASPRLAAGWKMSLSIKDCWQLSLPVDGYCQRSGHPSVKPFSTLEEGGLGELEKDGGDRGVRRVIHGSLAPLMIQKQRSHRVGERKMSQATYRPCRCPLAYHKGAIKPPQCTAPSLQINSWAAAPDRAPSAPSTSRHEGPNYFLRGSSICSLNNLERTSIETGTMRILYNIHTSVCFLNTFIQQLFKLKF